MPMRREPAPVDAFTALPGTLRADIEKAGYYPALVGDVLANALAGDAVTDHLVHQETTFDEDSIRRHVTVLATTASALVIVHADDHENPHEAASVATATSERVPLSALRGVMLTHVVPDPARYRPGTLGTEITLTIGWAGVSRLDVIPASCGDPSCDADHGFEGTLSADDISLRISAMADGPAELRRAIAFARTLSAVVGR